MFVPIPIYQRSESQADIDAREKRHAKEHNEKWYPEAFKLVVEAFSETWNVTPIETGCGGYFHAFYKKYPNVFFTFRLDLYQGTDSDFKSRFYVDEGHWADCSFPAIEILAAVKTLYKKRFSILPLPYFEEIIGFRYEDKGREAIKRLNSLVDRNVEMYCKDYNIPFEADRMTFPYKNEYRLLDREFVNKIRDKKFIDTHYVMEYANGDPFEAELKFMNAELKFVNDVYEFNDIQKKIAHFFVGDIKKI